MTTQKIHYMDHTTILDWLRIIFESTYTFLSSLIIIICGYFLPIKDIAHLILLFFFLDVIFGYWSAHKLRKERFSVKIIWGHTVPRMIFALVCLITSYMLDKICGQNYFSLYKVVGWFFSVLLLISIFENGYLITKWNALSGIANIIKKKVEDNAYIDVGYKKILKRK